MTDIMDEMGEQFTEPSAYCVRGSLKKPTLLRIDQHQPQTIDRFLIITKL